MRINTRLNLVIPVDTDAGTLFVHSVPISREVFEKYFLVISKAFAAIYQEGLNVVAGPRIAMLMLKRAAVERGEWDGPDGVQNGLVAEIRRLTNVAVPGEGGWKSYPMQDAIDRSILDADDVSEVEGAVAFFTCASAMHKRDQLPAILGGMTSLWDARTTSLNFTDYLASLRTSTEAPGTTTTTSSVPS